MLVTSFQHRLLSWYHKNKRPLPFRKTKDPYKIWLSEIMAQQTTMTVVLDYYKRFTKKFPNLASVAKASEQDLLTLWQGLGYYARVRNFQKACKIIIEKMNGQIPKTATELKQLPGVGDYTAAAIASICFNEPKAVIDGNVKRVLARLYRFQKDISSKEANIFFSNTSLQLLDPNNPGDFNQAMMELGALICTKNPLCTQCPVKQFCASRGKNPERLPVTKKTTWMEKKLRAHVVHSPTHLLLQKPSSSSLVKGMWEVPLFAPHSSPLAFSKSRKTETGHVVRHSITNKRFHVQVTAEQVTDAQLTKQAKGGLCAVAWQDLDHKPVSTLTKKILKSLGGHRHEQTASLF